MGVSEPPGGDAGLTALREELLRRDDAFERERGEKSSRAHIAADAEWEALYQSLKRAEKALAEASRVSGQCAQYIARRRRFCASRAADGCDGYCSLHAVGLGKALSRPAAGTTALQTADASERTAAAGARRGRAEPIRARKTCASCAAERSATGGCGIARAAWTGVRGTPRSSSARFAVFRG